jgi:hypothetical protein
LGTGTPVDFLDTDEQPEFPAISTRMNLKTPLTGISLTRT